MPRWIHTAWAWNRASAKGEVASGVRPDSALVQHSSVRPPGVGYPSPSKLLESDVPRKPRSLHDISSGSR